MDHDHDEQKPSEAELEAPAPAAEQEEGEVPAAADDCGIAVSATPQGLCIEVTDYHASATCLSWDQVKALLEAARADGFTP